MKFFNKTFGGNQSNKRFVSEKAFNKNKVKQSTMLNGTLKQLRKYRVTDKSWLKLEYFFYTDKQDKAAALSGRLKDAGYEVEYGISGNSKKLFIITGWTDKVLMDIETVEKWCHKMCEIGYECDCEFDGWGTNPVQDE